MAAQAKGMNGPTGAQMNYTQTISRDAAPVDLKHMADVLKMAGPQNWMLIDPQGRVWMGENPMVLAAHATYKSQDTRNDPPFKF
jgi:hypothetical protein